VDVCLILLPLIIRGCLAKIYYAATDSIEYKIIHIKLFCKIGIKNTVNCFVFRISEIGITYNPLLKPSERVSVTCSADAETLFRKIWGKPLELRESFYALFLNRANKVLGYFLVSFGGITGTLVDMRTIFQAALKANASGVIVANNHPSGNPLPSDADKLITKKLKEAGEVLDINLLDHIILLPKGYTSMTDDGLV
jgi:DNA repair protein RadC